MYTIMETKAPMYIDFEIKYLMYIALETKAPMDSITETKTPIYHAMEQKFRCTLLWKPKL